MKPPNLPPPQASRARLAISAGVVAAVVAAIAVQIAPLARMMSVEAPSAASAPAAAASRLPPAPVSAAHSGSSSNIHGYDYVGPEACVRCHAGVVDSWRTHPHSRMNRNATGASVVGDFSGGELVYADGKAVFGTTQGEFTMSLWRGGSFVRRYRVTRTVGSRFVQMYIGVQAEGPEPPDDPVYHQEVKLPFAYWIERKHWFPETYDETPGVPEYDERGQLNEFYAFYRRAKGDWKRVCVKCHNTYPYAARFDAAPEGKLLGFPAADVALKPGARRERPEGQPLSDVETWELVTLGISCESCHFGGREHALNGGPIRFVPQGDDLIFARATDELIASARKQPYVINSICAQCHRADIIYPPYPDGSSAWNSQEARELAQGACASKIRCTDCHNPHVPGPTQGRVPDQPAHSQACLGCHQELRAPAAASAHASHPQGAQPSCLDCHMPRLVHGLSGMTRSHRISSPTNPRMLEANMPNACNLCHLDRPLSWTLDALQARWRRKVDLSAGFSPPAEPLGRVWLAHKEPIVRQVAAEAYARSPLGQAALPLVVPILNDPNPPARMFGQLAVERLLGRRLDPAEYVPWGSPSARAQAVERLTKGP